MLFTNIKKHKIFLSYSRTDSEFALIVAKDLKNAGLEIWIDQINIIAGENWDRAIEEALVICSIFVVILSPAAVKSDTVMDEVHYSLENEKHLIPLLHQDCDIPFRLKRKQFCDFRKNYDDGINQLFRALSTINITRNSATLNGKNSATFSLEGGYKNNFSAKMQDAITFSRDEALRLGDDRIGTEHQLLGLLKVQESNAINILQTLYTTNIDGILKLLEKSVIETIADRNSTSHVSIDCNPPFTKRAAKVIKMSYEEANKAGVHYIRTEHFLLALSNEKGSVASKILMDFGVDYNLIKEQIEKSTTDD